MPTPASWRRFTCDLIIADTDGRHFEWQLEIESRAAWEAVQMAEHEVSGWNPSAHICELDLQLLENRPAQYNRNSIEFGPPREVVRVEQPLRLLKRVNGWLTRLKRKFATWD